MYNRPPDAGRETGTIASRDPYDNYSATSKAEADEYRRGMHLISTNAYAGYCNAFSISAARFLAAVTKAGSNSAKKPAGAKAKKQTGDENPFETPADENPFDENEEQDQPKKPAKKV